MSLEDHALYFFGQYSKDLLVEVSVHYTVYLEECSLYSEKLFVYRLVCIRVLSQLAIYNTFSVPECFQELCLFQKNVM